MDGWEVGIEDEGFVDEGIDDEGTDDEGVDDEGIDVVAGVSAADFETKIAKNSINKNIRNVFVCIMYLFSFILI